MRNELEKIRNWFDGYTGNFLNEKDRECIVLKIEHTFRVATDILTIGSAMGLHEEELQIAELCGLLHDIGRFEQYRQYRTFHDAKSVNHAEFGVKILREEQVLQPLPARESDLIITAIANHNRLHLSEGLSARELLFCNLLRDADKLDILKVVTDYYAVRLTKRNKTLELDLPAEGEITDAVFEAVHRREDIDYRKIRNLNDFKLLQAGWIYSINYIPALKLVKERGYVDKLRLALSSEKRAELIFIEIEEYLTEKLRDGDQRRLAEA